MSIDSSFANEDELNRDIPDPLLANSPDAIERNIDARRANIENLVDALESKLSPGQLIDQALTFTKENGGEFFGNLGTSIRNNPMPMLLTTVGISWLMLGQNQKPSAGSGGSGASMLGQLGEKLSGAAHSVTEAFSGATDHARESAHQASDKVGHLGESASQTLDDLKQQAGEKAAAMKDTLSSTAGDAQEALLRQSRNVQGTFQYLLREQPLALAAMGIALGAALGAALPSTEKEDKAFGKASDNLTQKAKATVSETWETVSDAGRNMADDLKNTAKGV
ncbi:uncharacterized protein DUF3618 [Pseudomonas graminis]|uniref:DUF3618 domain-containing protein n=1 Tax=Pseudomonas graminis TaxID=158627 RepID=UPI0010603A93|nr:DUF3618 domain-containing protein [Pseudomonas graminis]TDV58275.1 uncharacterized protein DUF3618 [Pseudomonas graminis]